MTFSGHYRHIIALNNVGISLLKKRAFTHATETFRCALNEMKMLVQPSNPAAQNPPAATFSNKVDKAYKVLMNLERTPQEVSMSPMAFDSISGFHLPSVLNLVLDSGCFSATLTPIKIELTDFENVSERDTDLDSAIILYNLALVHRSVAATERDTEKRIQINKAALRLFRMSFALVTVTKVPQGHCFEDEQAMIRDRIHANAIFLYFQTRTLFDMGLQQEAEESLRHLSILGTELADMMDMGFVHDDTSLPTAAAA
eukprot:scaffold1404_cov166-Amphora_coffeaeformis.AAC.20